MGDAPLDTTRPNFLVIGAARSSTTAVARALGGRSEVFLTSPKETHFWAFAGAPVRFAGPGDDEMFNRWLVSDPAEYSALYAAAGGARLRGDGSVTTLYHPTHAIDAISAYADPDVRLVCLVREPAARSLSAFLYLRSRGHEPFTDFQEGLAAEEERIASGHHHMWHYTRMSRYAEQLPLFADAFGDRLFVAVSEEIQAAPDEFSRRLCAFLGLPERPALDLSTEVNRGGEPRSRAVTAAFNTMRRSSHLKNAVKAVVPASVRERVRRANLSDRRDVDLTSLRRSFTADVAAVEDVLGRRVDAWHT
jgi:hypothetical protein